MEIGVFLLDDHELVRRGLREILTDAGQIEIVGESGSAREAVRGISTLRPRVALLGVRLPDGSGIEVCREVRARDPAIRVIILSSYDDPESRAAAVRAGASAYVLKQIQGTDLADVVHRVAAGETLTGPRPAVRAPARSVPRRREEGAARPTVDLTPQEERVLDLIVEGLTNRQIGERLGIAEKTVKNHVTSLMAKLRVERRTQAAVYGAWVRGQTGRWP